MRSSPARSVSAVCWGSPTTKVAVAVAVVVADSGVNVVAAELGVGVELDVDVDVNEDVDRELIEVSAEEMELLLLCGHCKPAKCCCWAA